MDNPIAHPVSGAGSVWAKSVSSLAIPSSVRSLVSAFYTLVDTQTESAFRAWTNLFNEVGSIEIGKKKTTGREELLAERAQSWDKIAKRKHHMKRIYTHHVSDSVVDLVVLGWVEILVRDNGATFNQEFAQRFLLGRDNIGPPVGGREEGTEGKESQEADSTETGWRISRFQAWIVSLPFAE